MVAKDPLTVMATHHQRGAFFSKIPAIRSVIHAIEWLFQTSGRLGIRSTNGIIDAPGSAIKHFPRLFKFVRAVEHFVDGHRKRLLLKNNVFVYRQAIYYAAFLISLC